MDLIPSAFFSSLIPSGSFNLTSIVAQPIMHSFTSLLVLGGLAIQAVLSLPDPSRVKEREAELLKRSVDSFIATESPIALADMLCNIGSAGACASGASSGIVVASPDKTNPDCKCLFFDSKEFLTLGRLLYLDSGLCPYVQVHCGYLHQQLLCFPSN